MSEIIEGLKLITLTGLVDASDDPSYPYKLDVNLSPPELAGVGWAMLHGGSEVVVLRGMTKTAIDSFIERNHLRTHPRLRRAEIIGPDGLRESFGPQCNDEMFKARDA